MNVHFLKHYHVESVAVDHILAVSYLKNPTLRYWKIHECTPGSYVGTQVPQ